MMGLSLNLVVGSSKYLYKSIESKTVIIQNIGYLKQVASFDYK